LQNHNLVLNLAAQYFTANFPGFLHVPFHKEGTTTFEQSQQAVLPVSALGNGLAALRNKQRTQPLLASWHRWVIEKLCLCMWDCSSALP